MPTATRPRIAAAALLAVIFSQSEADASDDFAGFWPNTDGWSTRSGATEFPTTEIQGLHLPLTAAADARWVDLAEADRLARTNAVKKAFDEDDHEVAQADDGAWYWADRQDMEWVEQGDYPTEEAAWRSLCELRSHVLEDAGISAAGLFGIPAAEVIVEADSEMAPR